MFVWLTTAFARLFKVQPTDEMEYSTSHRRSIRRNLRGEKAQRLTHAVRLHNARWSVSSLNTPVCVSRRFVLKCLPHSATGASTLVESCIEKKDLEKELVRYVQSLHEEKPAVLLGLLQRHQMDAKNCVEKQDIIRCVRVPCVCHGHSQSETMRSNLVTDGTSRSLDRCCGQQCFLNLAPAG